MNAVDVERRDAVRDRVIRDLGPEGLAEGPTEPADAGALPVAAPASPEEASALLRIAGQEGWRVLPLGSGMGPGVGLRDGPAPGLGFRADLGLSSRRWQAPPEHEPGDLTVTVQAGVTLGELDRALRREGQWLPLDPPVWPTSSVGGAVASGLGGPLALAFGRPRDQVLGLTLVDGEGRILKLGGRVVKNVAGFDLVRLAVGSRGALGVITSVSFRLYPVPSQDRTLVWEGEGPAWAWKLGRRLARLPIPVTALEMVCLERGGEGGPSEGAAQPGPGSCRVLARVLGSPGAVDRMARELEACGGVPDRAGDDSVHVREWVDLTKDEDRGELTLRARTLPDRGGDLVEVATTLGSALREAGWDWTRTALRPGTGELRFSGGRKDGAADQDGPAGQDGGPDPGLQPLATFREAVEGLGGTVRVLRLPAHASDAPGRAAGLSTPIPSGVVKLKHDLRQAFDPRGILPGAWGEGW